MEKNINFNYKNLSPFKWFVLENFPFIEADFDALTEWQLFCKLGKEINKIIDSQNLVGKQAEELTNAFNNLQNYVNNYFKNLDVQEEINNKLNEMAKDGTLENIIDNFLKLNSLIVFDNVENMKNSVNLINGSYAKTLGFYNINDGGNAIYKIRTLTNQDVIDNSIIIPLINNESLVAELIYNQELNVKTFGAKGDGVTDDSLIIQKVIDKANKGDTIYFPNGDYLVKNLSITKRINLKGQNAPNIDFKGTTLILADDNALIFDIKGTNDYRIVGSNIQYINFKGNNHKTTTMLSVKYAQFINFEYCSFNNVNGSAIQFACTFESGIYKSVIRRCGNEENGAIDFLNFTDNLQSNNVNNFHIENNTFGLNGGNWIKTENSSNTDILWIKNNKFEWDANTPWENENEQSVIYLGQIFRCFIHDNSFTWFKPDRNKYSKIIKCNRGSGIVSIMNNKLLGCDGTFITSLDPVIFSENNVLYDSNMIDIDVKNSQSIHQIKPSKRYTNNRALPLVYENLYQINNNYLPALNFPNPIKNNLAYDENSLNYTKQVIKSQPTLQTLCILNKYKDFYETNLNVKIRCRATQENLYPVIQMFKRTSSGLQTLNVLNAINSTSWKWYNFSIPIENIQDATQLVLIMNNVESSVLIDGLILPF